MLEILLDERVVGTVLACDYRADLAEAGIGKGNRAFFYAWRRRLPLESWPALRIRRAADGAELTMTPACRAIIEAARVPPAQTQLARSRRPPRRTGAINEGWSRSCGITPRYEQIQAVWRAAT